MNSGDGKLNTHDNEMDLEDDDVEFDDWEDEEFQQPAPCLFCTQEIPHLDQILEHLSTKHSLNLLTLKKRFNMDCYSYIKLINYIRTHSATPELIMECKEELWSDSKYLKPVVQDDPWLMYDFEDLEVPSTSVEEDNSDRGFVANSENGVVTLSSEHFWQLQKRIQELTSVEMKLSAAEEKIEQMKTLTRSLVTDDQCSAESAPGETDNIRSRVASIGLSEDHSYFESYAHYSIHQEMLLDRVRTESYRDALLLNPSVVQGRKILDLGCGSSILSMFAVKAGASVVIGIDQSEIIYTAMDIVRENSMEKQVHLIKGRIEDTSLPVEKVDVIVSEWMGYFLLFEGMLDSLLYARDKHLAVGGHLFPNRCSMSLVGVHDAGQHEKCVGFWKDVYGFKMTSLGKQSIKEPTVETVGASTVVTTVHTFLHLDLVTCTTKDYENIHTSFSLEALEDTTITALAGYFDVFFDLPDKPVHFSTGPFATPTHWKQTVFYLEEPIPLAKGQKLHGELACRKHRKSTRSLEVDITITGVKNSYYMN